MNRQILTWTVTTSIFFAVIGGLIGAVFVFSGAVIQMPFLTEKGVVYFIATFLSCYLIGAVVAGLSGVLYALARIFTRSLTTTNVGRRLACGVLTSFVVVLLAVFLFYELETTSKKAIWAVVVIYSSKYVFLTACTMSTVYLHSLAESAYQLFSASDLIAAPTQCDSAVKSTV